MNKIALVLIALGAGLITMLILMRVHPSVQTAPAPECLLLGGSPLAPLNILFIGDPVQAERYKEEILSVEPFAASNEALAFWSLNEEGECSHYREIALYCASRNTIKTAAACPHDVVIVMKEAESTIRSSSYNRVLSINTNSDTQVVIHELGHFFGLDEEYLANYNPGYTSINCKTSCNDFSDCFEECSDSAHKRSIENGIMRSLHPDNERAPFGAYNEAHILSLLTSHRSLLTGYAIEDHSCKDEQTLLLNVVYQEGKPVITGSEIIEGCAPSTGAGSLSYTLSDSEEVYLESASEPTRIYTDATEGELRGETFPIEESFILSLPKTGASQITLIDKRTGASITQRLSDIPEELCRV